MFSLVYGKVVCVWVGVDGLFVEIDGAEIRHDCTFSLH